ncbi:RNA 2',3'-cyclic phosphodiesterase [Chloroflexota bacterium]
MEQVRSFIAIELPDELRLKLSQLQAQLKSDSQTGVKWVDPYSIHLTLKFLGNIAVSRTDQVTTALEDAAKGISPFRLEVRELGAFPNLRRVQVVWVGVSGEIDKLGRLQQRIEENLAHLGFARESRAFTPHLTLARIRDRASIKERQLLGQVIANTRPDLDYTFAVDSINLMRSQLTREGAIYSRISSIVLKKCL